MPEYLYDNEGNVKKTLLLPWCKLIDADVLYNETPRECIYPSRYCPAKELDEHGKIYEAAFTEEEITKTVKI